MPRRVYATPEIKRQADETTTEATTAGAVATNPTPATSHYALTDVVPDQHHAQLHNLASPDHPDTDLESKSDGDVITWDDGAQKWVAAAGSSGIDPLTVFEGVSAALLSYGPATDVHESGVYLNDTEAVALNSGMSQVDVEEDFIGIVVPDTTPGDVSFEGFDLAVGPDYVGVFASEKDSSTLQLYPDSGNDIELVDADGGTWIIDGGTP